MNKMIKMKGSDEHVTRIIKLSDNIFTEQFYTPSCEINYVMVEYEIPKLDANFILPENTTQHTILRQKHSDEFSFLLNDNKEKIIIK